MSAMREYKETRHTLARKATADLSLYSAGHEACVPGHDYGPTVRSYQLIHFILRGTGTLSIDGRSYRISSGDAFIIPAGTISCYRASDDNPWDYAWVSFLGVNASDYVHMLMSVSSERYVLRGIDANRFLSPIERIIALGSGICDFLRANALLLDMLAELFAQTEFDQDNWAGESVADGARFELDMRFSQRITIRDIAHIIGVHPNYLTRCFRARFGTTPKRYLTDLRVGRAKNLLTETDSPISIIATSLGFDDQFVFSKTFKRETGVSPSTWRSSKGLLSVRQSNPSSDTAWTTRRVHSFTCDGTAPGSDTNDSGEKTTGYASGTSGGPTPVALP